MYCPFCKCEDTRVVDSRATDDGTAIRRRRQCTACDRRFTTVETVSLTVVKRSGVTEPFSRDKVVAGSARRAKEGRWARTRWPYWRSESRTSCAGSGSAELPAHEVGLAILSPLRELDEVAYLRFASVYRSFDTLEDFEAEITLLRAEREPVGEERPPRQPASP